ncbi:SLATT domain-containing protein [Methylocystis sp.]|uniref:SLATT domain-containing protein n=1 Tax=Methylocystis sp. TaxID=1911079 RepID=UPI003DA509C9
MANEQYTELVRAMKATAGSRFNAAKYLEEHDSNLMLLTAITSVYIIALTIIPYFWKLPKNVLDNLNLFTVVLSVVILVAALLQNSRRDAVNAEQHHRSGLEINELRREISVYGASIDEAKLLDFAAKYSAVLQKYSINHTDLDYQKYIAERPEQFPWMGWLYRFKVGILFLIRSYKPIIVLVTITIMVTWLIFFYAMPLIISEKSA